ncbi:MAG TPA: energy transducer TonB [Bacteroidota bacterium]
MKTAWDGSLHSSGYGAPELRRCYQTYMVRSLALAIFLVLAFVTPFSLVRTPQTRTEPDRPVVIIPGQLPTTPKTIQAGISTSVVHGIRNLLQPKYALPIPVADPSVDSADLFPSRNQPGDHSGLVGEFPDSGGDGTLNVGSGEEGVEPPPFRPVEKWPVVAKRVEPRYPETAIRAGIEGTVILNLWVDKAGKVRKAVVVRSDAQILDSSAQDAAMQWVFTPAIMQHEPVSVWVSIPFRFSLHGK